MMRMYTEVVFRLFCDLMKWGVCNCGFLGVGRLIDFSAPSTISFSRKEQFDVEEKVGFT
jgi:hypothetical protein